MKTIGLIGGMSWESSLQYYRIINETTKTKLGGLHSAKSILYSVDFAEVETLQHQGRWQEAAQLLVAAGQSLERAGADFIILCTNKYPSRNYCTIRPYPERKTALITYQKLWSGTYHAQTGG